MIIRTTVTIADEEIVRWTRSMLVVCAIDPLCQSPILVSQVLYDALDEYAKKRFDFLGEEVSKRDDGLFFHRRIILVEAS